MKKQVLCLILALVMAAMLLPMAAFAEPIPRNITIASGENGSLTGDDPFSIQVDLDTIEKLVCGVSENTLTIADENGGTVAEVSAAADEGFAPIPVGADLKIHVVSF